MMMHQSNENRINKIRKRWSGWKGKFRFLVIGTLMLSFFFSNSVRAANYDADTPGKIIIQLNDLGTKRLGVEFIYYKIGSFQESSWEFKTEPSFQHADIKLDHLKTADDYKNAAKQAADYAIENHLSGNGQGKTDEEGMIVFENLSHGLYLVIQTEYGEYGKVSPFLIAIPNLQNDGSFIYEVLAEAKGEVIKEETTESNTKETEEIKKEGGSDQQPSEDNSKTIQNEVLYTAKVYTGDWESIMQPLIWMSIAFILAVCIVGMKRKK